MPNTKDLKEIPKGAKVKLYESQKNYIVCAVLMIIVGIALIILHNPGIGAVVVGIGVIFAIAAAVMISKEGKQVILPEPESSKKSKEADKAGKKAAGKSSKDKKTESAAEPAETKKKVTKKLQ